MFFIASTFSIIWSAICIFKVCWVSCRVNWAKNSLPANHSWVGSNAIPFFAISIIVSGGIFKTAWRFLMIQSCPTGFISASPASPTAWLINADASLTFCAVIMSSWLELGPTLWVGNGGGADQLATMLRRGIWLFRSIFTHWASLQCYAWFTCAVFAPAPRQTTTQKSMVELEITLKIF